MTEVEWDTSLKGSREKSQRYHRVAMTMIRVAAASFVAGVVILAISLYLLPISLGIFAAGAYALVQARRFLGTTGLYATTNHFISRGEKSRYVDGGRLEGDIEHLFDVNGIPVVRKRRRYRLTEYHLGDGVIVQVSCMPQDLREHLLVIQVLIADEAQVDVAVRLKEVIGGLEVLQERERVDEVPGSR